MRLNNKGLTLIEIIVSIVLISIVLIFIFSLLITVNNMNSESEINSTYLINKALIIKNIEEDIKDATQINVSSCSIEDFYSSYTENENETANMCLKLTLYKKTQTELAYLGIYYYKTRDVYVISYINKTTNIRATRELPDFTYNNVEGKEGPLKYCTEIIIKESGSSEKKLTSYSYNCKLDSSLLLDKPSTITIPIIGSDGKDYSLIIPYYPKSH